jgi:hypothetical protein
VIDLDEARRRAQGYLDGDREGGSWLVITGEREFAEGWVFFYDSRQHQVTGALGDAIGGNAPLIVNRWTGELALTGTGRAVEDYLQEYIETCRRLREGWPAELDERLRGLLVLVRDGLGRRDARALGLYLKRRGLESGHSALEELVELERRHLVTRQPRDNADDAWRITAQGRAAIDATTGRSGT